MLTLGKLKEIAFNELSQIYDLADKDFRLEEYEYNTSNNLYNIVISFLIENQNTNFTAYKLALGGLKFERVFKNVVIDKDGNFIKFSIHNT